MGINGTVIKAMEGVGGHILNMRVGLVADPSLPFIGTGRLYPACLA